MDILTYLFAALVVVWAVVFFYVYRLVQKMKGMERDLEMLRGQLERENEKE